MRRGTDGSAVQLDRLVTDRNEQTINPATDAVRSRLKPGPNTLQKGRRMCCCGSWGAGRHHTDGRNVEPPIGDRLVNEP
jgi:hypothetical protein